MTMLQPSCGANNVIVLGREQAGKNPCTFDNQTPWYKAPFEALPPKPRMGDAHMVRKTIAVVSAAILLLVPFCLHRAGAQSRLTNHGPAQVDAARLTAADSDPGDWMSYSRTYSEQRFSPLDQINASNVASLKLAWYYDLDTSRG